jgi:hypothetical protein
VNENKNTEMNHFITSSFQSFKVVFHFLICFSNKENTAQDVIHMFKFVQFFTRGRLFKNGLSQRNWHYVALFHNSVNDSNISMNFVVWICFVTQKQEGISSVGN